MVFCVKHVQKIFNMGSKKHTRIMEFKLLAKIKYKYPNTDICYYMTSHRKKNIPGKLDLIR